MRILVLIVLMIDITLEQQNLTDLMMNTTQESQTLFFSEDQDSVFVGHMNEESNITIQFCHSSSSSSSNDSITVQWSLLGVTLFQGARWEKYIALILNVKCYRYENVVATELFDDPDVMGCWTASLLYKPKPTTDYVQLIEIEVEISEEWTSSKMMLQLIIKPSVKKPFLIQVLFSSLLLISLLLIISLTIALKEIKT